MINIWPYILFYFFCSVLMGIEYAPRDFFYESKSSKKIAFNGNLLKDVDVRSFQVLFPSDYFAVDKENLYFKENIVLNVKSDSFRAYSNYLGSDGRNTILLDDSSSLGYNKIETSHFTKISNHYFRDKQTVSFFRANSSVNSKGQLLPLKNTSANSFKVIYEEKRDITDPGLIIARDQYSVFVRNKIIFSSKEEFNTELLLKLPEYGAYLRIGDSVFYIHRFSHRRVEVVSPSDLHFINNFLISDGYKFYRGSKIVELKYKGSKNLKASNLKIFEGVWGIFRDSLYYLRGNKITEFTNVKTKNFKVLRNYCMHGLGCIDLAHDSERYFYRNRSYRKNTLSQTIQHVLLNYPDYRNATFYPGTKTLVQGADQSTFFALGDRYGKDSKRFYYDDHPITSTVDRSSFEVLSDGYAKDSSYVYYKGTILKNIDTSSFERVPGKFSDRYPSMKKYWKDFSNFYDKNGNIVKLNSK